jgi:hypothetical protein
MRHRFGILLVILGVAAVAVGCASPEQRVIENYFRAVNAGDNQTLTSFAAVAFPQKVEKWRIVSAQPEVKGTAQLPELQKKVAEVQAALDANKREYSKYYLDHASEVEDVKAVRKKGQKLPAKLEKVAAAWDEFSVKEKDLKRAFSEAKEEVQHEKRNVQLSLGEIEGIESKAADMTSHEFELLLTVEGQEKPYIMVVRKYVLKDEQRMSRWMIYSLDPKKG